MATDTAETEEGEKEAKVREGEGLTPCLSLSRSFFFTLLTFESAARFFNTLSKVGHFLVLEITITSSRFS